MGTQSRALSYAGSRRSSKWEEDSDTYWDELDPDYIQTLIDAEAAEYKKNKTNWNRIEDKYTARKILKKERDKEIEVIEASLTRLKKRITFLIIKKDKVIPWHEKLPADNQYRMYFLRKSNFNMMKTGGMDAADAQRNLLSEVGDNLDRKAERASRFESPPGVGRNKKRDFYA